MTPEELCECNTAPIMQFTKIFNCDTECDIESDEKYSDKKLTATTCTGIDIVCSSELMHSKWNRFRSIGRHVIPILLQMAEMIELSVEALPSSIAEANPVTALYHKQCHSGDI
jgi:hypothetical protein